MNIKRVIAALLFAVSLSTVLCGCGEANHNDGKCDICGKEATYSGSDEEYCDEHMKNAVEWYIKQGQD